MHQGPASSPEGASTLKIDASKYTAVSSGRNHESQRENMEDKSKYIYALVVTGFAELNFHKSVKATAVTRK